MKFLGIKKIGVISDTHIPTRAKVLPEKVFKLLNGVDLILHAGDIESISVLKLLEKIAPVIAVHGNMDPPSLRTLLPRNLIIEINNFKFGLIHGSGAPFGITTRIKNEFTKRVDCIIFGHTHKPLIEKINDILFFNPGSPTDQIFSSINTIGIITLGEHINGRIIQL